MNLDGTLFGPVVVAGLDRPLMLVGAHGHGRDNDPSWAQFWANLRGWRLNLRLTGAAHTSFTDFQALLPQIAGAIGLSPDGVQQLIGTIDPQRSIINQRAYVTVFFDLHLRHRDGRRFWVGGTTPKTGVPAKAIAAATTPGSSRSPGIRQSLPGCLRLAQRLLCHRGAGTDRGEPLRRVGQVHGQVDPDRGEVVARTGVAVTAWNVHGGGGADRPGGQLVVRGEVVAQRPGHQSQQDVVDGDLRKRAAYLVDLLQRQGDHRQRLTRVVHMLVEPGHRRVTGG